MSGTSLLTGIGNAKLNRVPEKARIKRNKFTVA